MSTEKFELLRGNIRHQQYFENPKAGFSREGPRLPPRDPIAHKKLIEAQLATLVTNVASRKKEDRVAEAQREIIAIKPEKDTGLPAEALSDKREDVRLVSWDSETGVVIIDAPSADLKFLHTKLRRQEVFAIVDRARRLRNRIAHHEPIFNHPLAEEYDSVLELVGWICPGTARWVRHLSHFDKTWQGRPP